MYSLKRFYYSLAAGFAHFTRNKAAIEKLNAESVVTRVSREVNYYRTHFFNV
jgi:hypothetical protein